MVGNRDEGACGQAPHEAAADLLRRLEAYAAEVDGLRTGWDMEGYAAVARHFAAMSEMAAALPTLRTPWTELLISRFEFAQVLWDRRTDPAAAPHLHGAHERHAAAIRKLRSACVEVYGLRGEGLARN